jgi:Arc/MetJ-type ribon-helix-helix transcriptional regulator
MNIALPKTHAEWLQSKVADGSFASIDDAIAHCVEERMGLENDGLDWAIESVEAARAEVSEHGGLSINEHRQRNAERLARLRTP